MLDAFQVFTKGGLILFHWQLADDALKSSPVEALVKTCLLEERGGETEFVHTSGTSAHTLKWTFHNELGLVFVAVHQRILRLTYVEHLLESAKSAFAARFDRDATSYPAFEEEFTRLMKRAEASAAARSAPKAAPKAYDAAKKAAKRNDASGAAKGAGAVAETTDECKPAASDAAGKKDVGGAAFDMSKIKSLKSKKSFGNGSNLAGRGGSGGDLKGDEAKMASPEKQPKKTKEKRVWAGENAKGKADGLDFSEGKPPEVEDVDRVDISAPSRVDEDEDEVYSSDEDEEESAVRESGATHGSDGARKKSWLGGVMSNALVRGVIGKAALEREDIEPILEKLKINFMNKNVAEDIAERLCESVAGSLRGRKLASFSSLSAMVRSAMEEALTRILTPKRSIDILRDVRAAREAGRPYVITFVGVNGVGKSTNLSKVAYWLLQHDVKVMIAACDTFRAGAVEQLRTHCKRLGLPLFERGYEKDPANVAAEAVKAAQRSGIDAVLVDTAGRMQDNEPLMRALAKLVNVNEPDLVLFVGEALVGNDSVDQLSKFNQRLSDLSSRAEKTKLIDGIVLSKFDTVDDKVGAALSMVYTSGAPVMFVGCGQTYTDLRKLNVKSIVKILLSK